MKNSAWVIKDWAGNFPFGSMEFKTFDAAEEYLSGKLKDYDDERGEYSIEECPSHKKFKKGLESKLAVELKRLKKLGFNSMSEMLKAKKGG